MSLEDFDLKRLCAALRYHTMPVMLLIRVSEQSARVMIFIIMVRAYKDDLINIVFWKPINGYLKTKISAMFGKEKNKYQGQ